MGRGGIEVAAFVAHDRIGDQHSLAGYDVRMVFRRRAQPVGSGRHVTSAQVVPRPAHGGFARQRALGVLLVPVLPLLGGLLVVALLLEHHNPGKPGVVYEGLGVVFLLSLLVVLVRKGVLAQSPQNLGVQEGGRRDRRRHPIPSTRPSTARPSGRRRPVARWATCAPTRDRCRYASAVRRRQPIRASQA